MNKHKWYNEIVAWAEGKPIQFRYKTYSTVWQDYKAKITPPFDSGDAVEFRVKPNTIKYRLYLRSNHAVPNIIDYAMVYLYCTNNEDADIKSSTIETGSSFAAWLTDWIELEVKES